jgi:hypothetical protein
MTSTFRTVWLWCLLIVFAVSVACSDVRLAKRVTGGNSGAVSKGEFCVAEPKEVKPVTKILYIVDKSYSNTLVILPDGGTLPGTDAGAAKRGKAIDDFVTQNASKDYFRYGLVAFFYDYGVSYVTDPATGQPGFTPDENQMFAATQRLRTERDDSETPYIEALQTGLQVIKNDLTAHPDERSSYFVVFLSDGIPTVGQSDSVIFDLVRQIKQQGSQVILNAGYYGNYGEYTEEAKTRLKEMAKIGGGKFLDFNTTTNWDFGDFFDKPTFEPWFLSRFMVYNLSAGYCLDGSVNTDSDADGMCDKDEISLSSFGFDPRKRWSFGDGYGDYFHWRRFKYQETLPPCNDRADEDHDLLTTCEEKYIRNERAREDIGKAGDPKQYDTDRDGVVDGIETFVFFPRTMAYAMDDTNLMESFDGEEPAEHQISQHRNPLVVDRGALNYDSNISPIVGGALDCYKHDQRSLPLYPTLEVKAGDTLPGLEHKAQENAVFVYFIQKPQKAPRDDGVLKFDVQLIKNDPVLRDHNKAAGLLKIADSVFKTYVPPVRK